MDVELRGARKAFTIRGFEACHLEAMDGSSARQGAPDGSRTPFTLSGVSRKVAPPWQGEAARPTQVFDLFAAQAQGAHLGRILQEKAGRTPGRGGDAEASQRRRWGPLTECHQAPPSSHGVLVRSQSRLSSLWSTLLTQPHADSPPCPRFLFSESQGWVAVQSDWF